MIQYPIYQGKPTVYLDHNILDFFVKNGLGSFGKDLTESHQVVYSDETLKEIKKSQGKEDKFLETLKLLNAFHLKIVLDEQFQPTGKATLTQRDITEAYVEYNDKEPIPDNAHDIMLMDLQKIFGGNGELSFNDLRAEKILSFTALIEFITDQCKELGSFSTITEDYLKNLQHKFNAAVGTYTDKMNQGVPNPFGWSGVNDYRKAVKLGPKQLNNIEPPNVLEKITDFFSQIPPYSNNISVDEFFNLHTNPVYPEKPFYDYLKITVIYTMLNIIGYHPDSKLHNEKRFLASTSDQNHASMASFTDLLLSADNNFIKKTSAIYEYLNIKTDIQNVVFIKE
ncbi:hypothetical protein KK410_002454 [Salmonella enterica]|nr:hypothetical protein [Salmonella enterica]